MERKDYKMQTSRKDYKTEIVKELLKENDHIRSLAKKIKTSHTTIANQVKELEKQNIVDYKQKGRNNVYYLKKTIESRAKVIIAEKQKLIELIKKYPQLRNIIKKIQENKNIKMAILFGSYAKKIAKKTSDIDIYVETNKPKLKEEIELIDSPINVKIGKYDKNNILIKEIEKNHIIIKGTERYYEKNEFFN